MKAAFLNLALASSALLFACGVAHAQAVTPATGAQPQQQPSARPQPATGAPRAASPSSSATDLTGYGIRIEAEPRLIAVMAALEAAGIDAGATSSQSPFREMVRRDVVASLDADLRARLRSFYERHKLPAPATPAEQAARYVSLALALGPAPAFEPPARADDLPAGLLEVLDFAPLVREFYRRTALDERMPEYTRAARESGERLRPAVAATAREVLAYLHTRPQLSYFERTPIAATGATGKQKQGATPPRQLYTTRERERRFVLVPDPLAPSGAVNFRVVRDDYYAIVPFDVNPASPELRRAYLRFVLDPLVLRFNRDIAARRAEVRAMLEEMRAKGGSEAAQISPDVFLSVERSLLAAADARLNEQTRLATLANETSRRLRNAKTEAERAAVTSESQAERARVEDATTAQLADAYERGAVLAFFFAEQLRGLESSGFDVAAFFADMVQSFNPARERARPAEFAAARARHLEARRRAQEAARANNSAVEGPGEIDPKRAALVGSLRPVEELLRTKNHAEARTRLQALMLEHQGEPRIFFALGQADSVSAEDAFDEELRARRLNSALANYRNAVERADAQSDRDILCRAHAASGRILAFLERNEEAAKAFDGALGACDPASQAYRDAQTGKSRLSAR